MPYGNPPKKQKKPEGELQDVDKRVKQSRDGHRDAHFMGVHGYTLYDGVQAVPDPCQWPATYSFAPNKHPTKQDGRLHELTSC